jgi:hypothetical protein
MATNEQQLAHGTYCPACGYDLRGTLGENCSECGTPIERNHAKVCRIPWVYRRYRGTLNAYVCTLSMASFKPWSLARESKNRLSSSDARSYHRITVFFSTLIATALIAGSFSLGDHSMQRLDEGSFWVAPTSAILDRWWAVIPFAAAVGLSIITVLACFRVLLGLGSTGWACRRLHRICFYDSGMALWEAVLLGLGYAGICLQQQIDRTHWGNNIRFISPYLPAICTVLALLAVCAVYVPGITLVLRTGRRKALRAIALILGYPAILALGATISLAVFWAVGYVAIAIWSLTH